MCSEFYPRPLHKGKNCNLCVCVCVSFGEILCTWSRYMWIYFLPQWKMSHIVLLLAYFYWMYFENHYVSIYSILFLMASQHIDISWFVQNFHSWLVSQLFGVFCNYMQLCNNSVVFVAWYPFMATPVWYITIKKIAVLLISALFQFWWILSKRL